MRDLTFCPNCGAKRAGAFRYCESCHFDLAAPARPRRMLPFVASMLLAVGLGVIALFLVLRFDPPVPTTVKVDDLPPPGVVWFGSSFDNTSFLVAGRTGSVAATATVAAVAQLSAPSDGAHLTVRESLAGHVMGSVRLGGSEPGTLVGVQLDPLGAGDWRIEFVDDAGRVLATGGVTAR